MNIRKIINEAVHEIFLEASIESVRQYYNTRAQERFAKAQARFGSRSGFPKSINQLVDLAFEYDPTTNKQYSKWLIEGILTGNLLPEDASDLRELLSIFSIKLGH